MTQTHHLHHLLDRVHHSTRHGYAFGAVVGTAADMRPTPGVRDLRSHLERVGYRLAHHDEESAARYTAAALAHIATMRRLGFTTPGLRAVEDGLTDLLTHLTKEHTNA